jgi:hypothetical protein
MARGECEKFRQRIGVADVSQLAHICDRYRAILLLDGGVRK